MSARQPRSHSAGVVVDDQTINDRPATDGESQHAMVERILRERSKERALRRVNSHRLQRFAAVAKETSHYSTAGVTEDLLKQKMARHHLTERGEDCGSFRSTSSRTSDMTRETRGTSSSWTTTATVTEMRSNVSSSTQHSGGGGGVAAGMQQRRRIDRISGGGGSATSSSSRGAAEGDPDEDDEDTRQLLENGGHICVVKSNFAELLLSVPAGGNGVAKAATAENMAVVAGGGNDDGPAAPPPSTSPTTLAGAIPLSLRGLVVSRKASTGAAPPLAVASSSPRGGPPTPPMPSDAAASTAGEGTKQGSGTAAARPAPRRASAAVPWPSSSSSVGQPKSILKRHPIPRKHRRRVHFSELHRFVEASHVLETSSSLRLSKDGPPVAFSILDLEVGGATTAPLGAAASGSNINSGEIDAGTPAGWGPDSAEFNREWGLRSPVNMTGVRSTENSSDTTQQQPSSSGQRTTSTKHRGRLVEKGGQQRAVDFLAASYHTGLSMEEARLLSAIAEVNAKLRETGFQKHRSTEAGASSSTRSNHAQPSTRPSQAAPPPAVATTTTTTAPTANRSAGGGEDSDGSLAYHLAHPPAAASLLPEPSSAGRHLGGIVVDAFLHQPYQPRSTSAPPTAATARNAPTPTPFGNARQVIVVPQETNLPAHVAAGLPKRKSDHQGLTRRDRFGKRMSVVGR